MNKYVGTYRVFAPLDMNTNKVTANPNDTYLLANRGHIECYRYDKTQLALYFPTGKNSSTSVIAELNGLGVETKLHIDGDYEQVYLFNEKDLATVHIILKFQFKGKNIKPTSVKTERKQAKKVS